MNQISKLFPFLPVFLVYALGLGIDVIEIDAAQYAAMSVEMMHSDHPLLMYCRGNDYLDKPPFLFWINALFFKFFGISNYTYKLPSLLFSILGIYSTYRFTKKYYDEETGIIASLVLSTTLAWFQFNNDVRTDTILAGAVIFSIWQLCEYLDKKRWIYFWGATIGISIAMLTKGPIGLMVPVLGIGLDLIYRKQWKLIFKWQWLFMLALVLVILSPMLWGLYQQFDLHPGKVINGQKITSGIRFYFWTQSFGRITGESNWVNDPNPLSFFPVLLWAFFPWSLFLFNALFRRIKALFKSKNVEKYEYVTLFGFILPFIAFSFSRFKLPHYIFVLFPLGAVMTSVYIKKLIYELKSSTEFKIHRMLIYLSAVVVLILIVLVLYYVFPFTSNMTIFILIGFMLTLLSINNFLIQKQYRLLGWGVIIALSFNLFLNIHFYPELLKYQAHSNAAKYYYKHLMGNGYSVTSFYTLGYSYDFYSHQVMTYHESIDKLKELYVGQIVWIYTNKKGLDILSKDTTKLIESKEFIHYRISHLRWEFLNPKTRDNAVQKHYLVKMQF